MADAVLLPTVGRSWCGVGSCGALTPVRCAPRWHFACRKKGPGYSKFYWVPGAPIRALSATRVAASLISMLFTRLFAGRDRCAARRKMLEVRKVNCVETSRGVQLIEFRKVG